MSFLLRINNTNSIIFQSDDESKLQTASYIAFLEAIKLLNENNISNLYTKPRYSISPADFAKLAKSLVPSMFGKDLIQSIADFRFSGTLISLEEMLSLQWELEPHFQSHNGLKILKTISKLVLLQLRKERLITLPANTKSILPPAIDINKVLAMAPVRLQTLLEANETGSLKSIFEVGAKGKISSSNRTKLTQMYCSCLIDVESDITPQLLQKLATSEFPKITIKYALSLISMEIGDKDRMRQLWGMIYPVEGVTVFCDGYREAANTFKYSKSFKVKETKRKAAILSRQNGKVRASPLSKDRSKSKYLVHSLIDDALKDGEFDFDVYQESLIYIQRRILSPRNFISRSPLPDYIDFDWKKNCHEWVEAQSRFLDAKNYVNDKAFIDLLTPMNTYLFLILPVWFHFNKSSIKFPSKIEDFVGAYFISRPEHIFSDRNLPPTFAKYVRVLVSKSSESHRYNIMRITREFFDTLNSRKEIFGLPSDFVNPVLPTDVPKSPSKKKATHVRIPGDIYWLLLLYSYKLLEIINAINDGILSGNIRNTALTSLKNKKIDSILIPIEAVISDLGLNIDTEIKHNNISHNIETVPLLLFSSNIYELVGKKTALRLINPAPLVQIIVALETGLRHQSIQWLSIEFDKKIKEVEIDDNEIYMLHVSTDKIKNTAWTPVVSGRVIRVLRDLRSFRDLIDEPALSIPQWYEGLIDVKWGKEIWLFANHRKDGLPHSDGTYSGRFNNILAGLQGVVDSFNIDFRLYSSASSPKKVDTDITPHSTRVTVVSELSYFLPPEYIGEQITGQSVSTVGYYSKLDGNQISSLRSEQRNYYRKAGQKGGLEVHSINTTGGRSSLVKDFKTDHKKAVVDYMCISTSYDTDVNNGVSFVGGKDSNFKPQHLSFESGHICPYNNSCPDHIVNMKLERRCEIAPCAIRSVDHLPYISASRRSYIEQLNDLDREIKAHQGKLSPQELLRLDSQRNVLSENITGLIYAEKLLNERLLSARDSGKSNKYISFTPEAVRMDIQASVFPAFNAGDEYLIGRIGELREYPALQSKEMRTSFLALKTRLLANSGNIREALLDAPPSENMIDATYGIVKTLMEANNITLDELIELAGSNIEDRYNFNPVIGQHTIGLEHEKK